MPSDYSSFPNVLYLNSSRQTWNILMAFIFIYMEVNNGKESNNVEKNWKKVIQCEEYTMKGSRHYNILVLINHHKDLKKMLSSVVISLMDV